MSRPERPDPALVALLRATSDQAPEVVAEAVAAFFAQAASALDPALLAAPTLQLRSGGGRASETLAPDAFAAGSAGPDGPRNPPTPPKVVTAEARTPGEVPADGISAGWQPPASDAPDDSRPRYELGRLLGSGGMGDVFRARDHHVRRSVAVKLLREGITTDTLEATGFLAEARLTARLEHPGVVPIYDLGLLPDGQAFYTMREVTGRTLHDEILAAHADGELDAVERRVLVGAVQRAADAVGYAHAKRVVHRDLKPANIMVGTHGEVLVVDWGLARRLGREVLPAGTPQFISPEQARGGAAATTDDVYALGQVLYCAVRGQAALQGTSDEVIEMVRAGPTLPPLASGDVELDAIFARATDPDPAHRYPDGKALAVVLGEWISGLPDRERARRLVAEAEASLRSTSAVRASARQLRAEARHALSGIASHAPVDEKRAGWGLEDQAVALERAAAESEETAIQNLQQALSLANLRAAHVALATLYQARHIEAEVQGDAAEAARLEVRLQRHDQGQYRRYLAGRGLLTFVPDPADAEVTLHRYERIDRRLQAVELRSLGQGGVRQLELPVGSYLLTAQAEGRAPLRYPVAITRDGHWHGVPPEGNAPAAVPLLRQGALGPGEIYVPPGWFWCGGDAQAPLQLPHGKLWVDGFVLQERHVLITEYQAFLDALDAAGRADEIPALLPLVEERVYESVGRTADGWRIVPSDPRGPQPEHARWAITHIDWKACKAYARWWGSTRGQGWRLPGEAEWEKAARGVDQRRYPWGNDFDPSFCASVGSRPERELPSSVDAFPTDTSPYGVRHLGGLQWDMCEDAFHLDPAPHVALGGRAVIAPPDATGMRVVRGGSWSNPALGCLSSYRGGGWEESRGPYVGFRLARPVVADDL